MFSSLRNIFHTVSICPISLALFINNLIQDMGDSPRNPQRQEPVFQVCAMKSVTSFKNLTFSSPYPHPGLQYHDQHDPHRPQQGLRFLRSRLSLPPYIWRISLFQELFLSTLLLSILRRVMHRFLKTWSRCSW